MISIIKYNAGNVQSVMCALKRLNAEFVLTDDEDEIMNSDHVIFPGVGEARAAMSYLESKNMVGMIKNIKVPFLGICLGMQLLSKHSEESDTPTLSIIDSRVRLFEKNRGYKIPHIGWNEVIADQDNPLFKGINDKSYFYFVHSYYAEISKWTIAKTDYDDILFSSAVQRDNFFGVQFHPEKSGEVGERLLRNFIAL